MNKSTKQVVEKWFNSKNTKDDDDIFDYKLAVEEIIYNKPYDKDCNDYLHIMQNIKDTIYSLDGIFTSDFIEDEIFTILEYVDNYSYMIKMNREFKKIEDNNKKKLDKILKLFDED